MELSLNLFGGKIMNNNIPKTADGQIAYPSMKVYLCSPYSEEKAIDYTIYSIMGEPSGYYCSLEEERCLSSCGDYWDDGNTESLSCLYASKEECLKVANIRYEKFLKEEEKRQKIKELKLAKIKREK